MAVEDLDVEKAAELGFGFGVGFSTAALALGSIVGFAWFMIA